MDFYGQILRELVAALGGALFVANVRALMNRQRDAHRAAQRTVARSRPGSPVRGNRVSGDGGDLPQAPVARTVAYAVIGFFVMFWGLATLIHG